MALEMFMFNHPYYVLGHLLFQLSRSLSFTITGVSLYDEN